MNFTLLQAAAANGLYDSSSNEETKRPKETN